MFDFLGQGLQLRAVGKFEFFVVGKVQFQFYQRSEIEEFAAQSREFVGVAAPHLFQGQTMGRTRVGGDKVGHSFGL